MKYIALIICASYILAPIWDEVNTALHTIWHTIEMPNQILDHDFKTTNQEHTSHEHKIKNKEHTHVLLTFINELIENINSNPFSDEVPLEKFSFYKHINSKVYQYLINNNQWVLGNNFTLLVHQKTKRGYLYPLKEPPQFDI